MYFGVKREKSELSRARKVALLRLGDGNGFCFLLKSSISIRFFRVGIIRGFLTRLFIYKNAGRIAIDNFAGARGGNKCFREKGKIYRVRDTKKSTPQIRTGKAFAIVPYGTFSRGGT